MMLLCFPSRESLLAMEAWPTSPKGGLGVEPKCIAGIYSSTHIALDATHNDVVMITTYLFFKCEPVFCLKHKIRLSFLSNGIIHASPSILLA